MTVHPFLVRMDKQHGYGSLRMEKVKSVRHLLAKELPATSLIAYPLAVFILGHLLFDRIGAPFSLHVLQAAGSIMAGANPNEAISYGHVWAATAHIYLLVSFFVLVALIRWMWARAKGYLAFGYLSIAGLLIALGISYLINVDKYNRPIKAIFLFTFRSLQVDRQLHIAPILAAVNNILLTINLLSIIVPAVLCAFAPLLVREPNGAWTEEELMRRVKDARLLAVMASVFLVAGVLHMYAWMSWAPEILNKDGLETVVGSCAFYWGSVFTMMLASYYFPILLVLRNRAEAVMEAQQVPLIERDQWLQRRGLSVRIANQLPQVIGILGPLMAAPTGKFLARLSELAPK
jgi:hypothetical protein